MELDSTVYKVSIDYSYASSDDNDKENYLEVDAKII